MLATLSAFSPALDAGFVDWDDDKYLLDHVSYRGLSWRHLRWMFTTTRASLYQPLTWLSFGVDYRLWGLQPWGYHLTNVLLHAASALLFYFVCLRLFAAAKMEGSRERTIAATVAALAFAVHPLRVESVAWITERKDVLAGVFFNASLLAYLWAIRGSSASRGGKLALSVGLFACSLAAKAAGLMLPAALLILDWFPLRRDWRKTWTEKAPFAALSACAAAASAWALARGGELAGGAHRGISWRVGQALYGLWFYPAKTAWPLHLSAYYPPLDWFASWHLEHLGLGLLTVATAVLLRRARDREGLAAAGGVYCVLILPALGLVQVELPARACDRFGYLPSLALSAAMGWIAAEASRKRKAALALVAAVLACWGALTYGRAGVWRDPLTLWVATANAEPSSLALSHLGVSLLEAGRSEEGLEALRRAADRDPGCPGVYENQGVALLRLGRDEPAREALARQVEIRPTASALLRLAIAELRRGQPAAALAALDRAVILEPSHAGVRHQRARALQLLGRSQESLTEFQRCLALDPGRAAARVDYGTALAALGRWTSAEAQYKLAAYDPQRRVETQANWAQAALALGRYAEAESRAREALRLSPALGPARLTLGNALARQGRLVEAQDQYRRILASDPDDAAARANLEALRTAVSRPTR